MKNKKLAMIVAAFAVLIALFAAVYFMARPDSTAGSKTVTVTVVHKDGSEQVFTCHTNEEFLGPMLRAENLAEIGADGMVTAVDGEAADWNADNSYWALYVGEEYGVLGADQQPIADGDSFKWVYTIG